MSCLLALLLALPVAALAQDSEPFPAAPSSEPEPEPRSELVGTTDELFSRGYERFAAADFSGAVPLLEEVLRREPGHRRARNYLVESLRALGRGEEADAARGGASSDVPEARVAASESVKEDPDSAKRRRNPRAFRRASAGVGFVGPAVGTGAWLELRPSWIVAINVGVGGLVIVQGGEAGGIVGTHVEATLAPLPFRLTPTLGVGLSALFGDQVVRTDRWFAHFARAGEFKLLPYFSFGARYDAKLGLQFEANINLVPSALPGLPLIPVPGFRLGFHFG